MRAGGSFPLKELQSSDEWSGCESPGSCWPLAVLAEPLDDPGCVWSMAAGLGWPDSDGPAAPWSAMHGVPGDGPEEERWECLGLSGSRSFGGAGGGHIFMTASSASPSVRMPAEATGQQEE